MGCTSSPDPDPPSGCPPSPTTSRPEGTATPLPDQGDSREDPHPNLKHEASGPVSQDRLCLPPEPRVGRTSAVQGPGPQTGRACLPTMGASVPTLPHEAKPGGLPGRGFWVAKGRRYTLEVQSPQRPSLSAFTAPACSPAVRMGSKGSWGAPVSTRGARAPLSLRGKRTLL